MASATEPAAAGPVAAAAVVSASSSSSSVGQSRPSTSAVYRYRRGQQPNLLRPLPPALFAGSSKYH